MGNVRKSMLRHKEDKNGDVKRLKNIIRRLESDKKKLLSELKTLEEAFYKNVEFLKGKVDDHSLEDLIEAAKEGITLKDIAKENTYTKSSPKEKWKCFKCEQGTLVFIPCYTRQGEFYRRRCNNCDNQTEMKVMKDGVDKYNGK